MGGRARHASRGPARPGEVSAVAAAAPSLRAARRADARAARIQVHKRYIQERLENQGKTKQTKKRSQGATAKDVRAQSRGGTPSASGEWRSSGGKEAARWPAGVASTAPRVAARRPRGGVTLRGGNGPASAGAGALAATGAANDARSVRPALRGRRFAGRASLGLPFAWSKVRLSSDESSGPPRMSSKNGSSQSSATVDRRSGTSCVEINQRVRLC